MRLGGPLAKGELDDRNPQLLAQTPRKEPRFIWQFARVLVDPASAQRLLFFNLDINSIDSTKVIRDSWQAWSLDPPSISKNQLAANAASLH